ncbi:MAG: phosphomannomutase [Candidatus Doudnabacteria bacterium Gr01-1014_77]|uniref:Phosphomannomutase n=1 Tax=Candidatus Doudnabacteria bacterium Gr01-1014_77 TaxID=2017133 RepID=A0A554JBS7_9BACT|nr:MAG: phosphomannomutase [Candidatus Doudnabacteria bacterium Gr01-1014_77]
MNIDQGIFKAYDIRGIYPTQLNEDNAYAIARAFVGLVKKRIGIEKKLKMAVGSDMRLSSPSLKEKVIAGLIDSGVDVDEIGLVSTPTFYFSVGYYGYDAGIQVSASHNPKEYNGMKLVFEKGFPVSKENGIYELRDMVANDQLPKFASEKGLLGKREGLAEACVSEQTKNLETSKIKRFKIVIDPANAMGIPDMEALFAKLPCELIKMNFELDGNFPSHPADPMVAENIAALKERVIAEKADLGIGIDGDADRYFFIDEKGEPVKQGIMRGLMAQIELKDHPGATIAYDIRPGRITLDMIQKFGGKPLLTPVGHSLIKKMMVENNAIYGGESSGHFAYKFDYGTFEAPITEVTKFLIYISEENKPVSEIVKPYDIYFHSGEINMELKSKEEALAKIDQIKGIYTDGKISLMDGLSVEYPDFWFNLRPSNTEPLLRLAVEGVSREVVEQKVAEMKKVLLG